MKKLFITTLGICMTIFSSAKCFTDSLEKKSQSIPFKKEQQITYKTLNDVPQQQALDMISYFKTKYWGQKAFPQMNFWFNINVVREMYKSISDMQKIINVDGFRIYFVYDTVKKSPGLIIVMTTDSTDIVTKCKSHRDYYGQLSDEQLLQDSNASGASYYKGDDKGANMYKWNLFGFAGDITCDRKKYPHYITRHTGRKMANSFGENNLTTVSEWFSTDILQSIINDTRCNGMRIYFGTHDSKYVGLGSTPSCPENYQNMDAFVVVTTQNKKGINKDYFSCETFQTYIENIFKQKGVTDLFEYYNANKRLLSGGQDNGSLCPLNCN